MTAPTETPADNVTPEFASSSTYYELANLIDQERPYANSHALPNLRDQRLFSNGLIPERYQPLSKEELAAKGLEHQPDLPPRDTVDVFGALFDAREGSRIDIHRNSKGEVAPVDEAREVQAGLFILRLNSGEEFRITKGIRIPYSYVDVNDEITYANIFVLYNGSGHGPS